MKRDAKGIRYVITRERYIKKSRRDERGRKAEREGGKEERREEGRKKKKERE